MPRARDHGESDDFEWEEQVDSLHKSTLVNAGKGSAIELSGKDGSLHPLRPMALSTAQQRTRETMFG